MIPVYHWESAEEPDARVNKIAETGSGVVIGEIRCDPGYDRPLNFHEISRPRWSADSSLLLWKVNGKFSPDALVLLKIENNRIKWQLDLLKTAQQEILVRTRKAAPVAYAIAKTVNAANGSHYPEGFNIDVTTDSEDCRTVSLPLVVRADLSSNPKQIENLPTLTSNLDAVVRQDGGFVVRMFRLGER